MSSQQEIPQMFNQFSLEIEDRTAPGKFWLSEVHSWCLEANGWSSEGGAWSFKVNGSSSEVKARSFETGDWMPEVKGWSSEVRVRSSEVQAWSFEVQVWGLELDLGNLWAEQEASIPLNLFKRETSDLCLSYRTLLEEEGRDEL